MRNVWIRHLLRRFYRRRWAWLLRSLVVEIECPVEQHGTEYGGWTLCPQDLTEHSIVYSFGVGEDISFDRSLIEHFGLSLYAFDPTPSSIEWVKKQTLPEQFHLVEYGLANYDGTALFYPPENVSHISHTIIERTSTANRAISVEVRTLSTLLAIYEHQSVDLLKMDIEGAEYDVLANILSTTQGVSQILVEFHPEFVPQGYSRTRQTFRLLRQHGYQLFHISSSTKEFSFIKF